MIRTCHEKHREFEQKIKITIIDISYKFYLQKKDVTFSSGYNHTPKVASNMQRFAYSSSFIPCENQRELLTSRVVCAVNRYECFMENKNLIRTLCRCKLSKETKLISSKFYWLIKKCGGPGLTPRYTNIKK